MKASGAILITLLMASLAGHSQNQIVVSGRIIDSARKSIPKATIQLYTQPDSLSTFSQDDGTFTFYISYNQHFELRITMEGFEPLVKIFQLDPGPHFFRLPPILLKAAYQELVPATVTQVRPIRMRQDTVEYFANAFPVRAGDELEMLLKKFPGLHVNADGSVIFQGQKIAKVMIDGKNFVGGDVAAAIRNLPADIVESIQLIDDYGDKGRLTGIKSGESEKTLNIVLKQDKRDGQFGKAIAGVGNKDRYNTALFADAVRADRQLTFFGWANDTIPNGNDEEKNIHFGYADTWTKKWSGNGGLGIWGNNLSNSSSMIQNNLLPDNTTQLQQENQVSGNGRNSGLSYTFEYRPDPNTRLRLTPSLYMWESSAKNYSNLLSNESDSNFSKTTTATSNSLTTDHKILSGSDVYFERAYPGSGSRLSATMNMQFSGEQQTGDQQTNTVIFADSLNNTSLQHYLVHSKNTSKDFSGSLNYYLPVEKSAFLELGYAVHFSLTQTDRLTQVPDSLLSQPLTVDSLSNEYTLHLMANDFHIGYLAHINKLNFTLGLNAQPAFRSGQTPQKGPTLTYHFFNILPLAQLSYSFSPERKINLNYSDNTKFPDIRQLQPVTDLSNPQYPVTGNPALRPSTEQVATLHYEESSAQPAKYPSFGVEFKYTTDQNMVITNTVHLLDTSSVIQSTSYLNANGIQSFSGNYHFDLPTFFSNHLRIWTSGTININQTVTMTDNILYRTNNKSWDQDLSFTVDIPNTIESELSGGYSNSRTRYSASGNAPFSAALVHWALDSHCYLLQKWVLGCTFYQLFTSSSESNWQANPAFFNAYLEREFFRNNHLKLHISAYDLLNNSQAVTQLVTITSVTQNKANLLGRYFLLSLIYKFEKNK
jgi:hypothetical protein